MWSRSSFHDSGLPQCVLRCGSDFYARFKQHNDYWIVLYSTFAVRNACSPVQLHKLRKKRNTTTRMASFVVLSYGEKWLNLLIIWTNRRTLMPLTLNLWLNFVTLWTGQCIVDWLLAATNRQCIKEVSIPNLRIKSYGSWMFYPFPRSK